MKEIQLTQGQIAIVDDDIFDWLMQWKWHAHYNSRTHTYYVHTNSNSPNRKTLCMHRLIIGARQHEQVDHKDLNPLNNLRSNLRLCTNLQNQANKNLTRSNTTGYKGVTFREGKWEVSIRMNNRKRWIGQFDTAIEAANAYDAEAERIYGEYALTNRKIALRAAGLLEAK